MGIYSKELLLTESEINHTFSTTTKAQHRIIS